MDNVNSEPKELLRLLILDDEKDIINSLIRVLRKEYVINTFNSGVDALEFIQCNDVDIILSDMRMPIMSGADFLAKSREYLPDATRILLTGHSDMESTIKAINDGDIFSYMTKPWNNEDLKLKLSVAGDHYKLKRERNLLSQRLLDANKTLEAKVEQRTKQLEDSRSKLQNSYDLQKAFVNDVLDMMSYAIECRAGLAQGDLKRVAVQARSLAQSIGLDKSEQRAIYFCALLHDIGSVSLSDEKINAYCFPDSTNGKCNFDQSVAGAELIGKIKRMSFLAENIRHQNENFNGTGFPDHLRRNDIPIGSRIIRIVKDFDYLIAGNRNDKRMSILNASSWMMEKGDVWYDKKLLKSFLKIVSNPGDNSYKDMIYSIGIEKIKPGDTLTHDLIINGNLMLKAGQEVSQNIINILRHYEDNNDTKLTVFVN